MKACCLHFRELRIALGPGKPIASSNGIGGKIIGGWSVSSILQFRGGSVGFTLNQAK
jgi:hypothetical protein